MKRSSHSLSLTWLNIVDQSWWSIKNHNNITCTPVIIVCIVLYMLFQIIKLKLQFTLLFNFVLRINTNKQVLPCSLPIIFTSKWNLSLFYRKTSLVNLFDGGSEIFIFWLSLAPIELSIQNYLWKKGRFKKVITSSFRWVMVSPKSVSNRRNKFLKKLFFTLLDVLVRLVW